MNFASINMLYKMILALIILNIIFSGGCYPLNKEYLKNDIDSENQELQLYARFGHKVTEMKTAIPYSKNLDLYELSRGYDYEVINSSNQLKIWYHGGNVRCMFAKIEDKTIAINVTLPKGKSGTLKVFLQNAASGSKVALALNDKERATAEDFAQTGKWVDCNFTSEDTLSGKLIIAVVYLDGPNIVVSAIKLYTNKSGQTPEKVPPQGQSPKMELPHRKSPKKEPPPNTGSRELVRMNLEQFPSLGSTSGPGITVKNNLVMLANENRQWNGQWNVGQLKTPGNGRIVLKAEVKGGLPYFQLHAYGGMIFPEADFEKFNNGLYEAVWVLNNSAPQTLSALLLTLNREGKEAASAKILELSIWQSMIKNKLDADKILETPPVHRAELKLHNGAMTMFLDGKPISGQMWSPICLHNLKNSYLNDVLNGLDYPIAAIPFAVGENRLQSPALYPTSWTGLDEYDWSYIDKEARRVLAARPGMKLVLMLALDGAVWWNQAHPEAANVSRHFCQALDIKVFKGDRKHGDPIQRTSYCRHLNSW